jgi:NAD(P)-dependent dehydrogenase (short-subunit alcohol dehydrogenase family)
MQEQMMAFYAYQETMRQFLQTQEHVLSQFLPAASPPIPPQPQMFASAARRPDPPRPLVSLSPSPAIAEQNVTPAANGAAVAPAISPASPTVVESDPQLDPSLQPLQPLPRYLMQAHPQTLPAVPLLVPAGLFLITEDQLGVAPLVAQALQQQGAKAAIIPRDRLTAADHLAEVCADQRRQHGTITGIVHLAALETAEISDLQGWRNFAQIHVKSLFHLLQWAGSDLQQASHPTVLAASLLGGNFGRAGQCGPGLATGGGSSGLLKTLIQEWPNVQARVVDCDGSLRPENLAEQLLQELLLPGGSLEVGYPQGHRTLFRTTLVPMPWARPLQHPTADWIVLVTGGSRGITADVVKAWMQPGMTVVIAGRSPTPPEESGLTREITDPAQLRRVLLDQARAEGQSPTPVQIEKALQALLNNRISRQNLQWFQERGRVEYHSVDVRDATAFAALIEDLYARFGRLDAVIHGAGIIEDKLLLDKQPDSFDRVFDTKSDSAFLLSRLLRPDSLKLLVFFSSIAGRYGSRGQSDYAAANEVVNRVAWQLDQQWPSTRIVSINWGPWDSPGMASEGVKRQFRERGIVPIPLPAGCQFFVNELTFGRKGETEIVTGEGPWIPNEEAQEALIHPVVPPPQFFLPQAPLLLQQPELQPNSTVTLHHTFSLSSDPYLGEHRLDGRPVLPAAGGAEWLAEFVQAAWPELIVTEIRDLRVMNGVGLPEGGELPVLLQARASSHADPTTLEVAAEIQDPQTKRLYYRATVLLEMQRNDPPMASLPPLQDGTSLPAQWAYRDYLFHGPHFELIRSIDRISPAGIDAWVIPSDIRQLLPPGRNTGQWLLDLALLDSAPQLATTWSRFLLQTTALPSRFGRVIRYGTQPLVGPLYLQFRVKSYTTQNLIYDAVFADPQGRVWLEMREVEGHHTAALNRLGDQWSV